MGLIHMPAGVDARFYMERADQSGIAFQIHNTDFIFSLKSQILFGDVHKDGEPLLIPLMPKYLKVRIPDKEIFACTAIGFR